MLAIHLESYLVTLVFSVFLADTAHEWAALTSFLQTHKLNGVHLVLGAHGFLMRLISQRHSPVLRQSLCRMSALGTLRTQVSGTNSAINRCNVSFIFIAAGDALTSKADVLEFKWALEHDTF